jgi:hypothetical protein
MNILLGGMLAIAVFTFAVMASPPSALAKGKLKTPPGQVKKMQHAGQIPEYARNYVAYMASHGIMKGYPGNMFKPLHPVQRAEIAAMLFRCQNIYSLNPNFNYLSGEVAEVLPTDPAFIIVATGEGTGDSRVMVQVADDAAIFVDGEAAELEDVEEGYTVSVVLNPARKAVVVSARTEGDAVNDDEDDDEDVDAPVIKELQPGDGDTVDDDVDELTVRFNEEVRWVDEDYEGYRVLVFETDTNNMIIPDEVVLDEDELIIKFDENLDDGEYSVTIPAGIIEDLFDNKFNGIGVNDWVFEVE